MSLIGLLVVIVVLGLIYYLVTLLPLPEPFKKVAVVLFIVIAILVLLSMVGLIPARTGP